MDNYDTIDRLILPVKKKVQGHQQLQSSISKPHANTSQGSQNIQTEVKTFSSLLLNKNTNKRILKSNSILNVSQHQALSPKFAKKDFNQKSIQPRSNTVIKIIVEPITRETQTSKALLKRKHIKKIKKIQKTVSNTENCINEKSFGTFWFHNHKTLDVRETNSSGLLKNDKNTRKYGKNEQISLSCITYTRQILESLSMDNKRRKEKPNRFLNEESVSPRSPRNSKIAEGCKCVDTNNVNKVFEDMNSPKNRVKIVGRFGINENDQYVLNCAATVNDKPIDTRIEQVVYSESTARFENNTRNSRTSKATQANTSICLGNDMVKNTSISNKTIQCNCKNVTDIATTISFCELNKPAYLSPENKSPLIVISVYPTKEASGDVKCLDDLIQLQTCNQSGQRKFMSSKQNKILKVSCGERNNAASTTNMNKSQTKTLRSRSPSPAMRHITKQKLENNRMEHKNPKTEKTQSSDRHLSRNKMTTKFERPKNKLGNIARTTKVDALKNRQEQLHESKIEKNKIKKAIVDEYTKKFLKPFCANESQEAVKRMKTKQIGTSNVTIDIDGENEQYRVLFLQNKVNTDLAIRKTLKTQKGKDICKTVEPKRGKRKTSQNQKFDNSNAFVSADFEENISGLKIRDSLDVNHRRESNNQYEPFVQLANKKNTTNSNKTEDDKDKGLFVKHYRGDKCCVPSPAVRDQEIRELLGIKKHRAARINIREESLLEFKCHTQEQRMRPDEREESRSLPSHQSINSCININDTAQEIEKSILVTSSTQYDQNIVPSCQQIVPRQNMQVFLLIDHFTKQKPIKLSRIQYDKVKKIIQKKVTNKVRQERRRRYNPKSCTVLSIGERRNSKWQHTSSERIMRTLQAKHNIAIPHASNESHLKSNVDGNKPLVLLYSTEKDIKEKDNLNASTRQTVSSMEIRYASMTNLKHVTFSSGNLKSNTPPGSLLSNFAKKRSPSIQTIFKGHKKSVTPNLGTSACSLYSNEEIANFETKNAMYSCKKKPKKSRPFLRKLISCLLLKSAKASEAIVPPVLQRDSPSFMNSFDSYHLSTTFGGIDMTSSLYDTSASFYSNHTIIPIANMKRGFFSSVRGFLTNLKGQ